jgi:hypothetical protein
MCRQTWSRPGRSSLAQTFLATRLAAIGVSLTPDGGSEADADGANLPDHRHLPTYQLSPALQLPIIPASNAAGLPASRAFCPRHAPRSV